MDIEELKEWLALKTKIDTENLDEAALVTPQRHGEIMNLYSEESLKLKEAMRKYNILRLQRWKYYTGKQTDRYYKEHGKFQETVLKSDLQMYLDADHVLQKASEVVDKYKMKVELLENALKQMNQRPYLIKDAISWRQFVSGI